MQSGGQFSTAGFSMLTAAAFDSRTGASEIDEVSMCAMFGEQIKASFRSNFAKVEWPYETSAPTEVRRARLAKIDADISALSASKHEIEELLASVKVD